MSFNSSSENERALASVTLTFSIIGCLASIVTIILIKKMNITGYIKLILTMTWYQFLYDFTFYTGVLDVGNYPIAYLSNIGQLLGGIASSAISNWISFILLYIAVYKKSFDIFGNYYLISSSSFIIALPIIIIYSCGNIPENIDPELVYIANNYLYYYIRLISILLNFLMVVWIAYKNHYMSSKQISKTPADTAINTLCRRMMYYPILQSFGRSGWAYYEFVYGFDFNTYGDSARYAALIYAVIITPLVSVGYLIIFLLIEPHAYEKFLEIFLCIKPNEQISEINDSTEMHNRLSETNYRDSDDFARVSGYFDSFSIFNYYDMDRRSEREIFQAIDLNIDNLLIQPRSSLLNNNIQMKRISNNKVSRGSNNPLHKVNNLEINTNNIVHTEI